MDRPGASVEVEGLIHRFPGGRIALNRVSFSVSPGELVVIAGRNGSGKTTLIKHFNGLLTPSGGSVWVDGREVRKHTGMARRRVGLVFQDTDTQILGETVADDVAFGPENLGLSQDEIRQRVSSALNALGLGDFANVSPHLLSGGEKRRLAIAGVLAMSPGAICLDEPFSNLDLSGVRQVLAILMTLHQAGHTLVVVTHELEKILPHARRKLLMDQGRLVDDGPPETVLPRVEAYVSASPTPTAWGYPFAHGSIDRFSVPRR